MRLGKSTVEHKKQLPNNKKYSYSKVYFRKVHPYIKLIYSNLLDRVVSRFLSGAEIRTLRYIYDRSLGWGKEGFICTTTAMIEQSPFNMGTGLTYKTQLLAIKKLESLGLIYTHVRGIKRLIWVNVAFDASRLPIPDNLRATLANPDFLTKQFSDYGVIAYPTKEMAVLSLLTVNCNQQVGDSAMREPKNRSPIPSKIKNAKLLNTLNQAVSPTKIKDRPRDLDNIVVKPVSQSTQREDAMVLELQHYLPDTKPIKAAKTTKKSSTERANLYAIEQTWHEGVRVARRTDKLVKVAWGAKQFGQMSQLLKRVNLELNDFQQFIKYVSENWYSLLESQYFMWLTHKQNIPPNIGFLVSQIENFLLCWDNRTTELKLLNFKRREPITVDSPKPSNTYFDRWLKRV